MTRDSTQPVRDTTHVGVALAKEPHNKSCLLGECLGVDGGKLVDEVVLVMVIAYAVQPLGVVPARKPNLSGNAFATILPDNAPDGFAELFGVHCVFARTKRMVSQIICVFQLVV